MNVLEIRNLTKSYPGFMLDNLNLILPSGCIMGLIGENGAGKSTTIKLVLDMIHKDSGSITIFGKDNGDDIKLTKEDIGVVKEVLDNQILAYYDIFCSCIIFCCHAGGR